MVIKYNLDDRTGPFASRKPRIKSEDYKGNFIANAIVERIHPTLPISENFVK